MIFMKKERIKDLLLRARVVVGTSSMEISSSFGRLRQKSFAKKRAARTARLFFLIHPMKSLIFGLVVDVVKSSSSTG